MTDTTPTASLADELERLHNAAKGCDFDLTPADGPIAQLTLFLHENAVELIAALRRQPSPAVDGVKRAKAMLDMIMLEKWATAKQTDVVRRLDFIRKLLADTQDSTDGAGVAADLRSLIRRWQTDDDYAISQDIANLVADNLNTILAALSPSPAQPVQEPASTDDRVQQAVDAERERCAEIARCHADDRPRRDGMEWNDGYQDGCSGAAKAIRSAIQSRLPQGDKK